MSSLTQLQFDVDDLGGNSTSSDRFQHGAKAFAYVDRWPLLAVPRRPVDFATYDLLVAGALRSRANFPMRRQISNNHPLLWRGLRGVLERDRRRMLASRAFLFSHAIALLRHLDELPRDSREAQIVERMSQCLPSLFLTRHASAREFPTCGYRNVCPFCLARSVGRIYRRISGHLRTTSAQVLVLGRIELPAGTGGEAKDSLRALRSSMVSSLRQTMTDLKLEDGLITIQFGPDTEDCVRRQGPEFVTDPARGFRLSAALLAEVPNACITRAFESQLDAARRIATPDGTDNLCFSVRGIGDTDALRYLLCGTSANWSGSTMEGGDVGAFRYLNWNLANTAQFTQYVNELRGVPAYQAFGIWRNVLRRQPRRHPQLRLHRRQGRYRRRQALARGRDRQRQRARELTDELAQDLDQVVVEFESETCRLPGWRQLQRLAQSCGVSVSERHARRLSKHFKQRRQQS